MARIRSCRDEERAAIVAIVNAAAEAYRGVIPPDRWHEPYMPRAELDAEIAAGVAFSGYEVDGELVGVIGVQPVRDVDLIRHAYVVPGQQGRGIGSALLEHVLRTRTRQLLVGTWATAAWAIGFYRRHGFEPVGAARTASLLKAYWTIPERQVETSVVLAWPPLGPAPEDAFAAITLELVGEPGVDEGTGFGRNPGLRVDGKIFAMLVGGSLVVKLPAERSMALVEGGGARRFQVGRKEMREWVCIQPGGPDDWDALVREALTFVRT